MNWKNLTVTTGPSVHAIQPLTLGNIFTVGPITTWQENQDMFVKKYEVIETSEDVLALSCAWHRLRIARETTGAAYVPLSTLLQKELFGLVTFEDREKANQIRDYYSKKLMMWKLLDKRLTSFREDLNTFIHDNSKKISEKMLPLAYRLPEFFEYDQKFDEMSRQLERKVNHDGSDTKSLTPLITLSSGKKYNRKTEYWLKDQHDNANLITVQVSNPLKPIWDRLFDSGEILNVTGANGIRMRDDFEYREFTKWDLA